MTSFVAFWPQLPHETWTDEAVAGLVGQEPPLTVLGRWLGKVRIRAARRTDDGILVTYEVVPPPGRHVAIRGEGSPNPSYRWAEGFQDIQEGEVVRFVTGPELDRLEALHEAAMEAAEERADQCR